MILRGRRARRSPDRSTRSEENAAPSGRERAGAEIGRVAVLLMATLFAAIIRPAAREIYASRAQAVREAGYDSWLIVELDDYDGDPREAAEISKTYLDGLLKDFPV